VTIADCNREEEPKYRREPRASNKAIARSLLPGVAVVWLALALPLWAQQTRIYRDGNTWVEEMTGTMPAARELRITTDMGSVQVQGNAARVSYVIRKRSYAANEKAARREFEHLHISARREGDKDLIEGKAHSKYLGRMGVEFVVQVPRDFSLINVQTRGGALTFSSIAATLVASTGAGTIKLDDLSGPVKISSGGGNVEAGNLGNDLTLTSGAANVRVASVSGMTQVNLAGGRVYIGSSHSSSIQTGAGSIQVQKCAGDLRVVSGGGNLYLGDIQGAVHAETQGGSVRLDSATGPVQVTTGGGSVALYKLGRGAQVETGAGPIMVEFLGNHGFTDSFLHTAAGDVSVCFADHLPVTVHATSDMASGRGISSDFSGLKISQQGGVFSPRSMSAEGSINGGGPALRVRTTIGQIAFHRCH
jgi:DUF4097 and DUF4098 domain-containing protein YvlB